MITVNATLSYERQAVPPIIPVVQGDSGRNISFALDDYTIPDNAVATFYIQKPSGAAVYNTASIISATSILVELDTQCLAESGENHGQIRIALSGEVITSFDFILLVKPFRGMEAIESHTEMNIFDEAVADAIEEIGNVLDPTLKIANKAAESQATGNAIKAVLNKIAPEHDDEEFYSRGDACNYGGNLYVCNAPEGTIIQGDFIESEWIAIPSVMNYVMQNKVTFSDPNNDGHIIIKIGGS